MVTRLPSYSAVYVERFMTYGIYPPGSKRKVVAMIQVFGDESGIHEGSKHCIVAGYVAGYRQWVQLGKLWSELLYKYRLPDIHAKDLFNWKLKKSEPYIHWTKGKELPDILSRILTRSRKLKVIGAAVECEVFNKLTEDQRKFLTGAQMWKRKFKTTGAKTKPYFLAFHECVIYPLVTTNFKSDDVKVHYIFDKQDNYKSYAVELFDQITKKGYFAERAGGITFDCRSRWPGLQLADLLAHLARARLAQEDDELKSSTLRSLLEANRGNFQIYDEEKLDSIFRDKRNPLHNGS